jgi:predicted MFS family arabinose efflux permease
MEQQTNTKFTAYQTFLIVVLALLQFSVVLDFMIIAPLGDLLMKTLNVKPSQFSLIVSSYAFSAAASGILTAGFADKFDRKKLLIFFYSGFIIGTFLCGISNSFWMLLVARIITGLFGGVIGSISLTIVADMFEPQQRGRTMSFIQMAFAASQILGIPLGIILANNFGWHSTFFMIVVLAVIVFVAIVVKLKPMNEHLKIKSDKNPLLHLWHTVSNKKYQIGFLAIAFLSIGGFMLMPFTSSFLINNVSITQQQLPIIFMIIGLCSLIVMPFIGKLSDKIDKFKIFVVGSLIATLMILIYTHLSVVPIWEVTIIYILVMVGIMGRMIPAQSLNTMIPVPSDRGAYMSITSSLQQIAGGLGAVIAGLVVKQTSNTSPLQHFDILGYVISVVNLACIYFVYRVNAITKANRNDRSF